MLSIGICGKPNSGKSTFFSAATLVDAAIAPYPFTTINANVGAAYVRAKCPHVEFGVQCKPKNSKCVDGVRLVPTTVVDVAGLVPGAHAGRGLGNKFLDDIRATDAVIQVVDASGRTDLEGNPCDSCDPSKEVEFLREEIGLWMAEVVGRAAAKARGRGVDALVEALSGMKASKAQVEEAARVAGVGVEKVEWKAEEVKRFAFALMEKNKPMMVAANKIDVHGAEGNLEKLRGDAKGPVVIPCYADGELALRKAGRAGVVKYVPGAVDFEIVNANAAQAEALEKIRAVMKKFGGTGVQKAVDAAAYDLLKLIVVYPVQDAHKLSDNFGNVLPDALLLKQDAMVIDLAAVVHTDLAKKFIGAVDARTGMNIGRDHALKNGDVISIVSGR